MVIFHFDSKTLTHELSRIPSFCIHCHKQVSVFESTLKYHFTCFYGWSMLFNASAVVILYALSIISKQLLSNILLCGWIQ